MVNAKQKKSDFEKGFDLGNEPRAEGFCLIKKTARNIFQIIFSSAQAVLDKPRPSTVHVNISYESYPKIMLSFLKETCRPMCFKVVCVLKICI